jgi:hypothetical protein
MIGVSIQVSRGEGRGGKKREEEGKEWIGRKSKEGNEKEGDWD